MQHPKVFHLIQKAHSALFRAADRSLKRNVGLSTAEQAILFTLRIQDGAPITAIAEQLKMGKPSLTGIVDRMSERSLLERRQSDEDGRRFEVFILPAGKEAVDMTLSSTKRINSDLLEPFSKEERQVIERFLLHVSDNAETIVSTHSNSHPQSLSQANINKRKTS
jgi:DNA-binding MarR family transcriptional regulator